MQAKTTFIRVPDDLLRAAEGAWDELIANDPKMSLVAPHRSQAACVRFVMKAGLEALGKNKPVE